MMWRLALRTVRARLGSYLASAGVIIAGTALLTAFAALAETGLADPSGEAESLTILAAIMGGWTVVIVAFGVVSAVALVIQQRERELALLRSIGTSTAQLRRAVLAETIAIALPAVVVGALPGVWLGAFLLDRVVDAGVVSAGIELVTTWRTPTAGAAVSLLSAALAAAIVGRRAAGVAPVLALAESADGPGRSPVTRAKLLVATGFLAVGLGAGIGTLFMSNGPMLAAAAGPACIGIAIGLTLLSPAVVATAGRAAAWVPSSVGRLAVRNLSARAARASTVVGPLVLLVGIATGTLYMQSTEDSTLGTARRTNDMGPQFAAANYLVVAMIIMFCVIAVTNTLIAATRNRRREFGLLRLTASTRPQVLGVVAVESTVSAGIAVVLGTIAAAVTAVPYSIVKTGSPIPSGPLWMYLAIAGGAFLVALAATVLPTLRATRVRPIAALTT
ncbi:putative ABC transport system permease protein [Saccharopolyspora shandongensis]|uniref:Putative ABC transport system permease protein n=1 Tax=Saccharopolyspora shandongensis TaxID=418495 RepID=A0A1H3FMC1_9PSEU|nr:FtsX-like permease family protein [Saccharopolyspora shandongensis]SDX92182.1 putative ABC transport system permease protein [Saccharopolyspora shandongensis]